MAAIFGILSCLTFLGRPLGLPETVKTAIDAVLGPVTFTLGCLTLLVVLYLGRRFFVRPAVAWTAARTPRWRGWGSR